MKDLDTKQIITSLGRCLSVGIVLGVFALAYCALLSVHTVWMITTGIAGILCAVPEALAKKRILCYTWKDTLIHFLARATIFAMVTVIGVIASLS